MPPKNARVTKGNAAKKEQIAEKVKEIQQRQKNWMRQRDEHLKTDPDTSISKPTAADTDRGQHVKSAARTLDKAKSNGQATHGVDILKVHHDSSQFTSEVSDKLNVKVKHGFGAWLQSRKQTTDNVDQEQVNGVQHREPYSTGLDQNGSRILRDDKSYTVPSSAGVSSLHSSSRSHPLSPAEFDTLADSIASRVKRDLGIKHSNVVGGLNSRHQEPTEMSESSYRGGQMYMQEERPGVEQSSHRTGDGDGDGTVDVSSHQCPFCSTLMTTFEHTPMLLVPCGHTLCKHCSASHSSCRLCGTRVASLTTNIMLQQIIREFHCKSLQGVSVAHRSPSEPIQWERQRGMPLIPPKTTTKHHDVNYSTQLQSLLDRQSTLQEEASSCRRERDRITSQVKRAEKQLNAIQKAEDGLLEQLQQLQDELHGLRQQKEEYAGEYEQLQEEQKRASDQVSLVERTLKSLEEEIDKVKFLAEGQDDLHYRKIQHR